MTESELIAILNNEKSQLQRENASLQAKLDSLMLEYCPEEMSQEQIANWGKNQRRVPDCDDKGEEHDYIKGSSIVSNGRRMCRKCLCVEPSTEDGKSGKY